MIESETGDFICYKKCGFFVKLDKNTSSYIRQKSYVNEKIFYHTTLVSFYEASLLFSRHLLMLYAYNLFQCQWPLWALQRPFQGLTHGRETESGRKVVELIKVGLVKASCFRHGDNDGGVGSKQAKVNRIIEIILALKIDTQLPTTK